MNKKKQHHFDKLQKSSILFTQLGLVLALLVVYLAMEFTTVKKDLVFDTTYTSDEPRTFVTQHPPISIETKAVPKEPVKPKEVVPIADIKIDDNNSSAVESVISPDDEIPTDKLINSIEEAPTEEGDGGEKIIFILVEEVPIYPGCEGLNKKESKKCFTKQISKFVNKRFNTSVAEYSNISGKQRIWVEFTIDKTGEVVDIFAKSPYKQLEKEAIRVVDKLPKMIPGKQRTRSVSVKYTLPIVFFVE